MDSVILISIGYWMQVTMASPAHVVVTVICINADEENQEQGAHPPINQVGVNLALYCTQQSYCSIADTSPD